MHTLNIADCTYTKTIRPHPVQHYANFPSFSTPSAALIHTHYTRPLIKRNFAVDFPRASPINDPQKPPTLLVNIFFQFCRFDGRSEAEEALTMLGRGGFSPFASKGAIFARYLPLSVEITKLSWGWSFGLYCCFIFELCTSGILLCVFERVRSLIRLGCFNFAKKLWQFSV